MSNFSVQQPLNAKTSAPTREADKANGISAVSNAQKGQEAEVRQTEQGSTAQEVAKLQEEQKESPKEGQVERAVAKLNDYVQNTERKLEFQLDEDSGETVVRVYDKTSEELIRQIPNEEALELAKKLNQEEPLMLFSAQV